MRQDASLRDSKPAPPRGPDRLVVVVLTGHRRAEVAPATAVLSLPVPPLSCTPTSDQPDIHRFCNSSPRCATVSTAPLRLHIRVKNLKPDTRNGDENHQLRVTRN